MVFRVRVTTPAEGDIRRAGRWYSDHAKEIGRQWTRGVRQAIASLAENPDRYGLAHESDQIDFELRELLYGIGRKKIHRILFRILGDTVEVLAVRHAAQRDIAPDEM